MYCMPARAMYCQAFTRAGSYVTWSGLVRIILLHRGLVHERRKGTVCHMGKSAMKKDKADNGKKKAGKVRRCLLFFIGWSVKSPDKGPEAGKVVRRKGPADAECRAAKDQRQEGACWV